MINTSNLIELIFSNIIEFTSFIKINDAIDILIVAYFFYNVYLFTKDTRAGQVLTGTAILIVLTKISEILKLHSLYWILCNVLTVGPIALLIIFQQELRAGLEHLGRSNFKLFVKGVEQNTNSLNKNINEISDAIYYLAKNKIGALIIIERNTRLGDIVNSGITLNSEISSQLLINIFTPNTPLHDGAVVIKDGILKGASCFLPLSEQKNISKDLGTRHRAAIGISESSDCISIIASEETGLVSISINGLLIRNIKEEEFKNTLLKELYIENENPKINLLKREGGRK